MNNRKIYMKKYREANREKLASQRKIYSQKNKEQIKDRMKKYREDNKEKISTQRKQYHVDNKQKENLRCKKYRENNKQNIIHLQKLKRNNNLECRISHSIRNRIQVVVRNNIGKKAHRLTELLGCSVDECRKWLESKFLPGMTWDNYGKYGWHIDHIIPCALFDLTKPEEQLKCFHYTNLQPLWAEDNLSKKDKIQVLTSEGLFLV